MYSCRGTRTSFANSAWSVKDAELEAAPRSCSLQLSFNVKGAPQYNCVRVMLADLQA